MRLRLRIGVAWGTALQGRVLGRWWTILTFEPRFNPDRMLCNCLEELIGDCLEELKRRLVAMREADLWEEAP